MYYIDIIDPETNCTIDKLMNLSEEWAKYTANSLRRNRKTFKVFNYDFEEVNF